VKFVVVSLFKIIEAAKNLGCYPVANWAFRILLYLNFYSKKHLLVSEVETDNWELGNELHGWEYPFIMGQGYYIDYHCFYYDLLVLRYEAEYACIPMPLVKEDNSLWYALERAVFKDKLEHSRITLWDRLQGFK
jgi:hypothetical protein